MKRLVSIAILVILGITWAQNTEDTIQQHCNLEWPTDNQMQAYCVTQQREAVNTLNTLTSTNGGIPADAYNTAYTRCQHEWLNDYSMQAYCLRQQIDGYRGFHTASLMETTIATEAEREQIRRHCILEWSTDYSMLDYCKSQQLSSLNFLKSPPDWVSTTDWNMAVNACSMEWPSDYSMVEYCVKRRLSL